MRLTILKCDNHLLLAETSDGETWGFELPMHINTSVFEPYNQVTIEEYKGFIKITVDNVIHVFRSDAEIPHVAV
jgi:hypothetical protein